MSIIKELEEYVEILIIDLFVMYFNGFSIIFFYINEKWVRLIKVNIICGKFY